MSIKEKIARLQAFESITEFITSQLEYKANDLDSYKEQAQENPESEWYAKQAAELAEDIRTWQAVKADIEKLALK